VPDGCFRGSTRREADRVLPLPQVAPGRGRLRRVHDALWALRSGLAKDAPGTPARR
jgi:hypothetical protein